jgi:hypothetical protein
MPLPAAGHRPSPPEFPRADGKGVASHGPCPEKDPHWIIQISSCLQGVSKPRIAFEDKAQPDEKALHIQLYVSILKRV